MPRSSRSWRSSAGGGFPSWKPRRSCSHRPGSPSSSRRFWRARSRATRSTSVAEPLKAVTFDFWGTLFEWNGLAAETRRKAVRDFVARHRAELSPQVVDAAFAAGIAAQDAAWRQSNHFGPAAIIEHFLAELRLEAPPESRAELQHLIEDPEPERALQPITGVEAAITRLRDRGLRLGIVCDSGMMVGRVLRCQLPPTGLSRL